MTADKIQKTSTLYITRFIAAYGVLLFHFFPKNHLSDNSIVGRLGEAVNYFFFISGFVMILSVKRYLSGKESVGQFSNIQFWAKRFARIYPMYFLALAFCVFFHFCVRKYDNSIPLRFPMEALGLQRWLYVGSINFPGWSISTEFFFYFFFPFLLPLLTKISFKKAAAVAAVFLFSSILITYLLGSTELLKISQSKLYVTLINTLHSHPFFKFSIFFAGCVGGLLYMRNPEVVNRLFGFKMMLLSLVAILLLLMLMPKSNDWIEGGLLVPFYFALVLSICNLNDKLTAVLGNRFFIFLGEISYSVYILQLPVILVFKYVYQIDKFTDVSQFFWYSAILVMVSAILFYIVERPMQKWILGLFNREKNALAFK